MLAKQPENIGMLVRLWSFLYPPSPERAFLLVALMFSSPAQQKRSHGGGMRDVHHEPAQGMMSTSAFTQFVLQLKVKFGLAFL
jgi:hypothetical protein